MLKAREISCFPKEALSVGDLLLVEFIGRGQTKTGSQCPKEYVSCRYRVVKCFETLPVEMTVGVDDSSLVQHGELATTQDD